jgi:hypothetical protein
VKVKDILYAGAERGFYISFNGGASFSKLQMNFPVVPITDLIIRNNDLVASTAGRSFWILDDLAAFQQTKGEFGNARIKIYQPKPTHRILGAPPFFLITDPAFGQNPPEGVTFDYYIKDRADTASLTLEIMNSAGMVLRKYTNKKDESHKSYAGGPAEQPRLSFESGVNRFTWDLRTGNLPDIPGVFVFNADYRGHRVAPGRYRARMTWQGEVSETEFELLNDPKVTATAAEWDNQQQFMQKVEDVISEAHGSVNKIRSVRKQVETLNESLKTSDQLKDLVKAGQELIRKIDKWESNVTETRSKGFQDALNWPGKMNSQLFKIRGGADTHDPRLPASYSERLGDLQGEWSRSKMSLNELINKDISDYNRMFKDKNVPALMLEKKEIIINN